MGDKDSALEAWAAEGVRIGAMSEGARSTVLAAWNAAGARSKPRFWTVDEARESFGHTPAQPASHNHPSPDDCDESEPDERDREIARLRDAMTRWAERCAVMASEHAAYRRDTETLRKAAQAAVSRLEAEITDCRAALAAATPKLPEPPPNPLYRALAVRGDGVLR